MRIERNQDGSGIAGKVVAVTGASTGIGEATAMRLAASGARVVLGARGGERLEAVAERIRERGGDVATAAIDVGRREDVARLVELACERFGGLDVFVGNAGISPVSPLDDLRVDDWVATIDVNVKGMLFGIAAALPIFRRRGRGHFVTIASTAAYLVKPSMAVYAGSKHAVRAIAEGLRQETGGTVRVTTVSPGFVRTNLAASITDEATRASIAEKMAAIAIPPDAIARAVAFAIEQPSDVDVNEIVIRPTLQT